MDSPDIPGTGRWQVIFFVYNSIWSFFQVLRKIHEYLIRAEPRKT